MRSSASADNKVAIINVKHALSSYLATCHLPIKPQRGVGRRRSSIHLRKITHDAMRSYRIAVYFVLFLLPKSERRACQERRRRGTIFAVNAYQYVLVRNEMSRIGAFFFARLRTLTIARTLTIIFSDNYEEGNVAIRVFIQPGKRKREREREREREDGRM